MKNTAYEKPQMKKVELRTNKDIADTCWGYASQNGEGAPVYYLELDNDEWDGVGTWVGFSVTGGGNCKSVKGIDYMVLEFGPSITAQGLEGAATAELDSYLSGMGLYSNGGSNFGYAEAGFSTVVGQSW